MNYKKHYDLLVKRGKSRILEGYGENHHIIPKCLGGTDDSFNIVRLTAEEHYLAHQLLIKMYPNELKLIFAAKMMTVCDSIQQRNNKLYGWLRKNHALAISKKLKGIKRSKETREKMSKSQTGKKASLETRKKQSELKLGSTPWNKNNGGYSLPKKTEEHKEKLRKSHLGKKMSEAAKLKMKESWILRRQNPNNRYNQYV